MQQTVHLDLFKFWVETEEDDYYIAFIDDTNNKWYNDKDIAYLLNMKLVDYEEILITKFNGWRKSYDNGVYFKSQDNAHKAIDWIVSMAVMNKLTR
jgi:hypothetical protein